MGETHGSEKKYPLQIHIATVFIALVAILGLVLTIFSYQNARILQEHRY